MRVILVVQFTLKFKRRDSVAGVAYVHVYVKMHMCVCVCDGDINVYMHTYMYKQSFIYL